MQMCQRKDAAVNCVGTGDDSDPISGKVIERVTRHNTTTAIITITATIFYNYYKNNNQAPLNKYNKTGVTL